VTPRATPVSNPQQQRQERSVPIIGILDSNGDVETNIPYCLEEIAGELHAALTIPTECRERIMRALELLDLLQPTI
jgi:hypothetical protein